MDRIVINLKERAVPVYPTIRNLVIVPTKEQQIFTHEGFYGYDVITVAPIPLYPENQLLTVDGDIFITHDNANFIVKESE